ncbi:hypothetical protein, conserved [Babesia bigemina]|uniref:Uncharacterized protein n=1 Tax=Babesia bigemina TaxID=5866 RepID=A0A061DD74_BABBI|nr:hypothetical protein, conserved [Babesia bigemina]CDR97159.1 hypothetical protein, conserved [Babesia bigemina]|eukprot:XP_012769345.1 hypothetical protein, conserved [Babesia bigemina]
MRRVFLKRAYREAVSWFGSENYRKAFKCAPRVSVLQSDYRSIRSPLLMRMGTLDEVREALRLKIGGQQSLWDNCLGLTGVGEFCGLEAVCFGDHIGGKISVQGMNVYVSSLEDYVRKCLDSYTCMMPLLQQFCWLNLRIHEVTHVIALQPHGRPY